MDLQEVGCGGMPGTRHTHRKFKITLPNTDYAHEKYHK